MNYDQPWSAKSTFLGRMAANALLDNAPPARPSLLGGLAMSALSQVEPPLPPVSLPNLLNNRLLRPPPNQGDLYLRSILQREAVDTSATSPLRKVEATLWPVIWAWANGHLLSVEPSGSFSKGTANISSTDIDLFISVSPNVIESLREMYDKLERALQGAGYATRRQNVSINVTVDGQSVDLVPAKRQNFLFEDHSLYRRKIDSWTKTNVAAHALLVRDSGRIEEIRVMKLWRDQWGLDWPSFYLELTVLRALGYFATYGDVAANVSKVFEFLRDDFVAARVVDPANTNNIISDDLTVAEKKLISAAGAYARQILYWRDVVR